MDYRTPESIYPRIQSKDGLLHELAFHANPNIKMHTPDSQRARRYHVEVQRPALRWLCKRFRVKTPAWLKGNLHYDELPPEQFIQLFGAGELRVREFRAWQPRRRR